MPKFTCGDVVFQRNGKYVPLMGARRADALDKFYRKKDLGDLVPFAFGHGEISHEEVLWFTCDVVMASESPASPTEELVRAPGVWSLDCERFKPVC